MASTSSFWLLHICLFMHVSISFWSPSSALRDEDTTASHSLLQTFKQILSDLSVDVHGYIVSVVGKQAVDTSLQCIRGVVKSLSEGAANVLNVAFQYTSELLDAAGIQARLPFDKVTPEGVLFVTQWALLALIGYWLLSLLFRLVAGLVRSILWLIKLGGALALFGLILSDRDAALETTVIRLACLVLACVVLGVGPSVGTDTDTNGHLEEKVRKLERQLRNMERKRKEE
ncbi:voltage-gated monoatomic cation channel TMEM109 [Engraulis encrasicolus]|uniref:voltage-gated monoatomic cation channel TMEM109 n=1 Tax=Engraulis encrasicolus TaxID=184585 RepID=UPI002FD0848A